MCRPASGHYNSLRFKLYSLAIEHHIIVDHCLPPGTRIQLRELRHCGVNEITQTSKEKQEELKTG